ncbi:MAG: PQQ-binding-like beta-propeller repeat protein, partial [Verrucomicrobiae bacterium]|nr:PQQ-binding-like beta-propeller repeat protein [Verrucomicrobiae bacterium]
QERWRYRFDELATIASSAIGAEGTVYVVVNSASVGDPSKPGVYALDGATGALLWMNPRSDLRGASLAIGIDGTVYVSAAQLLALEGTTGTQRWVSGAKYSWYSNSAIAADGTIYAGTADGHLYALNAATGETVWEFATDGATGSPTILDDGTVLVGARHGTVYAIQGTSGLAPSPWPKFQGDPQNSGRLYRFLQVGTPPPLVVLPEGNASRLGCSVKGRPLPALKWSRNGLEIPNATNAVLSLPPATREVEGVYRLTASNGVEDAEREITVVVSNVQTEDFPAWQWTSDGKALVLEQGPSLAGPWSDLAMFDAGETTGFHVETNPVGPARFYRLRGNASARFTVSGTARGWTFHDTPGTRHLIEYVDAEHGWTHWQTLTTLTLPASPYMFVDQDSLGSPERVYRTTPE